MIAEVGVCLKEARRLRLNKGSYVYDRWTGKIYMNQTLICLYLKTWIKLVYNLLKWKKKTNEWQQGSKQAGISEIEEQNLGEKLTMQAKENCRGAVRSYKNSLWLVEGILTYERSGMRMRIFLFSNKIRISLCRLVIFNMCGQKDGRLYDRKRWGSVIKSLTTTTPPPLPLVQKRFE